MYIYLYNILFFNWMSTSKYIQTVRLLKYYRFGNISLFFFLISSDKNYPN